MWASGIPSCEASLSCLQRPTGQKYGHYCAGALEVRCGWMRQPVCEHPAEIDPQMRTWPGCCRDTTAALSNQNTWEMWRRGTLEVMLHHTAAKRWDTAKLLLIIRSIASGLHYLHTRSPPILHRDIKPGNLFVGVNQVPLPSRHRCLPRTVAALQ